MKASIFRLGTLVLVMFVLFSCSKEEEVNPAPEWVGKKLILSYVVEEEYRDGERVGTERMDYAPDPENFIEFAEDGTYYFQFRERDAEGLIGESGTYDLPSKTMTIDGLPEAGFTFDYVDGYLVLQDASDESAFREILYWK